MPNQKPIKLSESSSHNPWKTHKAPEKPVKVSTTKEPSCATTKKDSTPARGVKVNSKPLQAENPWHKPKPEVQYAAPEECEELEYWRHAAKFHHNAYKQMKANFNALTMTVCEARFGVKESRKVLTSFKKEKNDALMEMERVKAKIEFGKQNDKNLRIEYCRAIDRENAELEKAVKRKKKAQMKLNKAKRKYQEAVKRAKAGLKPVPKAFPG